MGTNPSERCDKLQTNPEDDHDQEKFSDIVNIEREDSGASDIKLLLETPPEKLTLLLSNQTDPLINVPAAPQKLRASSDILVPGPSCVRELFPERESTAGSICQHCQQAFTTKTKLAQHIDRVHIQSRPFICNICDKSFTSRFKLVRHLGIHTDNRKFSCQICNRTFHRKDHLTNHLKVHNPVKKRLKCDRLGCNKEYSSALSFRRHRASHCVEDGDTTCTICGQIFKDKAEIQQHLKETHTGTRSKKHELEKKYMCDSCGARFHTGKDARRHQVVHTGQRDFLCQYCPQRFGRKDHLLRHVNKSHPIQHQSKTKSEVPRATETLQPNPLTLPSTSEQNPTLKVDPDIHLIEPSLVLEVFDLSSNFPILDDPQNVNFDDQNILLVDLLSNENIDCGLVSDEQSASTETSSSTTIPGSLITKNEDDKKEEKQTTVLPTFQQAFSPPPPPT